MQDTIIPVEIVPKKVLVCGGRDFLDREFFWKGMFIVHTNHGPVGTIISGAATGADTLAVNWAKEFQIPFEVFPANWIKYGKAAGPIRNREMLKKSQPDLVVAFPGGSGTSDMKYVALRNNVKLLEVVNSSSGPVIMEKN